MTSALMKLLTLVALLIMPFGMTAAPAMAQPMPADHAMMAMGEVSQGSGHAQHGWKAGGGHCDDQPEQDKAPVSQMDCAAMCTALPATDAPAPARVAKLNAPRTIALVTPFTGVVLEIATPPPR